MTPVKMETTSDCFRACLASMLDIPLDETIDLTQYGGMVNNPIPDAAWDGLRVWLMQRNGYPVLCPMPSSSEAEVLKEMAYGLPDIHVMLGGMTRKGVLHSVIVRGAHVIHDPAPVAQGPLLPVMHGKVGYYQVFLIAKIT